MEGSGYTHAARLSRFFFCFSLLRLGLVWNEEWRAVNVSGKRKVHMAFIIRMEQRKTHKIGKRKERMEKHKALGKIDRLRDRRMICTSLNIIVFLC